MRLLLSKQLGTYEVKDGPNVEGMQVCHLRVNNEDPELEPIALTERWPYDTASPNEFSIALLPVGLGLSLASVHPGYTATYLPAVIFTTYPNIQDISPDVNNIRQNLHGYGRKNARKSVENQTKTTK